VPSFKVALDYFTFLAAHTFSRTNFLANIVIVNPAIAIDYNIYVDAEKFSKDLLKIYPELFIYKTSINLPFELEKKDTLNSKKKKNKKEIKKKSKEIKKNSTPKK
jgi:hypothetical protein